MAWGRADPGPISHVKSRHELLRANVADRGNAVLLVFLLLHIPGIIHYKALGILVFFCAKFYGFTLRHALQVARFRLVVVSWGRVRPQRPTRLECDGQPPRFALRSTKAAMWIFIRSPCQLCRAPAIQPASRS